jgi:hypothetical protein
MTFRNERLIAKTQSDKTIILIPKIELEAAKFLEQEINVGLGLRPVMDETEKEMAAQFARQEQKLAEAGTSRQVIPLAIISIPLALILGVWLVIANSNAKRTAKESLSWPSITAEASGYRVAYHRATDSVSKMREDYYDAWMEYTYVVNNHSYTYEQFVPARFDTEAQAAQNAEKTYPPGTTVILFYNPKNPDKALTDRSDPGNLMYYFGAFMLGCGLLLIFVMLMVGRQISRAEGEPDGWKHLSFWRNQFKFTPRPK